MGQEAFGDHPADPARSAGDEGRAAVEREQIFHHTHVPTRLREMAHERTLILAEFITTASGGRSCPTDSRRWRSSGAVTFQSGRRLIGGAVSRTATRLREAQGGQERPCLRRQGPATRPGRRSAVLGRGLGGVVSAKVAARPSCLRLPDFRATEEARIERGTWKSAFERPPGGLKSYQNRLP